MYQQLGYFTLFYEDHLILKLNKWVYTDEVNFYATIAMQCDIKFNQKHNALR